MWWEGERAPLPTEEFISLKKKDVWPAPMVVTAKVYGARLGKFGSIVLLPIRRMNVWPKP